MKEKVLDIEIHHDTCQIVAHIDGSSDPMECKNEIMDLLEDLGYFVDGKWTWNSKLETMILTLNNVLASNKNLRQSELKQTEALK